MDALEFVDRYHEYVEKLARVVKPQYRSIINKLRKRDPHDIMKPEYYLNSEAEAMGIVLKMFLADVIASKRGGAKQHRPKRRAG